jgi:hypothetical protein
MAWSKLFNLSNISYTTAIALATVSGGFPGARVTLPTIAPAMFSTLSQAVAAARNRRRAFSTSASCVPSCRRSSSDLEPAARSAKRGRFGSHRSQAGLAAGGHRRQMVATVATALRLWLA